MPNLIPDSIARLDAWLDTMRSAQGYGGPVSHWWDSLLFYCGAQLDWRYEGILCGYINLYRRTNDPRWLAKAARACDDLVAGQDADGAFWNSSFEHGPEKGGTPHEAAACIGLLETVSAMRADRPSAYLECADRSIDRAIRLLWNGAGFQDQAYNPVLVANKNATMLEALLLYQHTARIDVARYIDAAAQVVIAAQVAEGVRAGATIHRGTFDYQISFGIYTARCVGAICRLMESDPRREYRLFVTGAARYLETLITTAGTLFGHYADERLIQSPRWIAPSGDLLRALISARAWIEVDENKIAALAQMIVAAQTPGGGIPTSYGLFARGAVKSPHGLPGFRDVLPVAGWCDKSFRALTMLGAAADSAPLAPYETACIWRGVECIFSEDRAAMILKTLQGKTLFHWIKGEMYPAIMELWD
jgi:hypothetical protein